MSKNELHPITEKINKKQKAKAKQARFEALRWLAKTFPKAFDDSTSIHPLKIGIMSDLLDYLDKESSITISRTKLREAVILFTRRIDYLACLKAREIRIDLFGKPTTQVTEDEAERAAAKIRKFIEKNAKIAKESGTTNELNPGPKSKPSSLRLAADPLLYSNDLEYESHYTPTPKATVVVKHKTSRTYDPEAVARLKEKMGLSKI